VFFRNPKSEIRNPQYNRPCPELIMSSLLRCLGFLLFLSLPALAFAQAPSDAAARVAAIAPFLDEHTFAVGHVNLKKLDPAAAIKLLTEIEPSVAADAGVAKQLTEMEQNARQMLQVLQAAGISELYLVVSLSDVPQQPPFIVAPLAANADRDKAASLLADLSQIGHHEIIGNAVVAAREPTIERLKALQPTPRPELVKAFQLAGDTTAQFIIAPNDDTRRVLREMLPRLPDEVGGGSGKMLADGVQWAVLSVGAPPNLSLKLTVQSKDADAASGLRGMAISGLQLAGKQEGVRKEIPEFDKLAALLTPQVRGDQLVLELTETNGGAKEALKFFSRPVQAMRTASGRAQSSNNLKQIALALHNYHDVHTHFPSNIRGKDGKPLLSWRVAILPYLEHSPLYEQFHLDEPWDSEHNKALIAKMPASLASPALGAEKRNQGLTSYLAPLTRKPGTPAKPPAPAPGAGPTVEEAIFDDPAGISFNKITDGTANSIMVLEAHPKHAIAWTKPDDLVIDPKDPFVRLAGQPNDGFNAAFADGSVRFISTSVDPKVFWWMILMNDGNPLPQ
jgi:prepilin-type processing-associated H-X9-DG protein